MKILKTFLAAALVLSLTCVFEVVSALAKGSAPSGSQGSYSSASSNRGGAGTSGSSNGGGGGGVSSASGASGLLSSGALRAMSASGARQVSTSSGGISWYGTGTSGSSYSISNSVVQACFDAGRLNSALSAALNSSVKQMSSLSFTLQGDFNLKGIQLTTKFGDISVFKAGHDLSLVSTLDRGNIYKDSVTGKSFGQDKTGGWYSVDSRGDWGSAVQTAFEGSGQIITGDIVTNQNRYGPDSDFQAVAYDADSKVASVYNVKAGKDGTTQVTLVGAGKVTDSGYVIGQIDSKGEFTGQKIVGIGDLAGDPANQIVQNMQNLGQTVFVYSKKDGQGIQEAKLFVSPDGSYVLREGNVELARGVDQAVLEFTAMREVAVALTKNGYALDNIMANMVNDAPGFELGRSGTKDGLATFTDQQNGKQYGLDMTTGAWYDRMENGEYQLIVK